MTQYDFGTINPVITTGTQLANLLNQWRDALATLHRGSSRPAYVQAGEMWIDDSADPVWIVKVCVQSGSPGIDAAVLSVNRSTGSGVLPVSLGGTGGSNATTARTALGLGPLAIKTTIVNGDVALGTLTPDRMANGTALKLIGYNGAGVAAEVDRSADIDPTRRCASLMGEGQDVRAFFMADGSIRVVGRAFNLANCEATSANTGVPHRVPFSEQPITSIVKARLNGLSGFAISAGGVCYAWGNNSNGQLGIGNTTNSYLARPIEFFRSNSIAIADVIPTRASSTSQTSTLFLTTTGLLYGAGLNASGELGDGTTTQRSTPVRCGTLTNVTMVSMSGSFHSVIAMLADGTMWAWGENSFGQLGLGDTLDHTAPAQISLLTNAEKIICVSGPTAGAASADNGCSFVLRNDKTVWATGINTNGQLGQGNTTNLSAFTRITAFTRDVLDISCAEGSNFSPCVILDGAGGNEFWSWGGNTDGQLGFGDTTQRTTPAKPTASFQGSVVSIATAGGGGSHSTFVHSGNSIWGVGYNITGNACVGHFNTISTFAPVLGINGTIVEMMAGGHFTQGGLLVRYSDGRVDSGGTNLYGELGTREVLPRNQPFLNPVRF